jgi:hypothetical protein
MGSVQEFMGFRSHWSSDIQYVDSRHSYRIEVVTTEDESLTLAVFP